MPRKVFVAGEVLTAADVNTNLADQAVMTFAGTAARGSAIGTAVEGMVTYLEDTDSFEYWDSSAWVPLVPDVSGDNLLYNGAMQVAQRGTSETGITSTGYYTADRWIMGFSTPAGTWTQTVESDAPTGSGFSNSLKMLVTTADAAPAANLRTAIIQRLEGQDVQAIKKGTSNAESLTLSFWVKANVTGTYIAELFDADNSRFVSASYDVSASATWEKKTITFPPDTSGVLNNDNGESLNVNFWLVSGSDYSSGTLGTTWNTTTTNRAVGQTNLAAATSNYWQVTGVQLETGTVASPFEHKPHGVELAECQRYYQKITTDTVTDSYAHGFCDSTTDIFFNIPFLQSMRTAPTALETTGTAGDYRIRDAGANRTPTGVPSFQAATDNTMRVLVSTTGLTAGRAVGLWANTAGYLAWSAEL